MPPDFRGKAVLVTGVGRVGQIGHAVALAFGRAGASLVIADVNATSLAERVAEFAAQGISARPAAGDLTTPDAARRAVAIATDQLGGLDAAINVAGGFSYYGSTLEATPQVLERELSINVKTAFYVAQAAIPALIARGAGAIVNFASIAVLEPQARMAPYLASKAAVAGLTRALAREFADHRVRVNAVAPAAVRTGDNVRDSKDPNARFVELTDLVEVVLFLASDAARGITGQIVAVAPAGG